MKRKMVIVRQKDIKDCGACCLSSIIRYYDGYVSVEKIRMDTFTSLQGVSVYHLQKAAENYGFDVSAKKISINDLSKIILPCIVHVIYENGLAHFMCLYEIRKNGYVFMDPDKGKIIMDKEKFESIFSEVILELYPKDKIIVLEKESNIYSLFFNILKDNKKLCLNMLLCSLFLMIFTIIYGLYFKSLNQIILNESTALIKYIIFLFLVSLIFKIIFNYLKDYYENHLNKNIDISVYKNFLNHLFSLPLNVIASRTSGEIITRVGEIGSIKNLFSELFVTSFLNLLVSLGSSVTLFIINKTLTLILLAFVLIYILFSLLVSFHIYRRIKKNIEYQTVFNSVLVENINMISSTKNLNETENVLSKIESKTCDLIFDNYSFTTSLNFINFFRNILYELSIFIINTFGFFLIYNNKFTLIELVMFNTFVSYFIEPIKNIISLIPKYNFLRASFEKICDFIDIKEETLGNKQKFITGNINLENVSFTYNDYNHVLENVNLLIKENEKVLLKGNSGCGKSTLCKLINRSIEPTKGNIYINDICLNDYSLRTIRDNIIYVGQKEKIFTGTIKENIMLNQNDEIKFQKICKICLIDLIVNKRKFRYNFGISNDSINISGGEKQRIILARALMKDSKILVLDEALSETDYFMEKTIINNIIKNFPYKTLIYVSHKKIDNLFERAINIGENYE